MKKQILLIEDDKILRENTVEILNFADYNVTTASNGKSGVKKAMKNKPDLILCDIMMPKLDGFGVYQILSKNDRYKKIPFIFLSAKTNHYDRRKGMELGADDYITKPFEESELLSAISIRLAKAETNNVPTSSEESVETETNASLKVPDVNALIELLCNRKTQTYKKDETLFCEGNRSNHVYLVKEGSVKTFKTTEEGKELITGLYKKRSFIGYTSSLGDFPYSENAATLEEAKIIKIEKTEIRTILIANPHIALDILALFTDNIENIKNKMLQIAYSSVRLRTAKSLLLVVKDDPLKKILMSRTNLANLIGVAKETLIRTLSDFKNEGLIESNRSFIHILDEEGLRNIK